MFLYKGKNILIFVKLFSLGNSDEIRWILLFFFLIISFTPNTHMHTYLHIHATMFLNGLNIILRKLFPVISKRATFSNSAIQPFSVKIFRKSVTKSQK